MTLELAPLAGFTDAPFRRMCFEGGADLCYTEMVSAAGLAHGSSPTRHLMETMPGEGKVAVQLFGAKPEEMAKAVAGVDFSPSVCEINLNAGCPMTKVTQCGAGAALVKDPGLVYELLRAIKENTSLPVSLKTRLGPHPGDIKIFDLLAAAERAGASKLIVHARFTSQMHGGETHLDLLKEVVKRAKISIIGNGSVTNLESARRVLETGVSGLMIGRAALAEPSIFRRLRTQLLGETSIPNSESTIRKHLQYLLEFREILSKKYPFDHVPGPDGFASVKMHTHLFRYFNGRPGAAKLRQKLNSVRTLSEIYDIISMYGE